MLASTVVAMPAAARDSRIAFNGDASATWQANGVVWALAQSEGTVYAGGTFTAVRPPGTSDGDAAQQAAVNFAAFDATTGALTSCQASFTNASNTATVRALSVSPDGRTLYVGGAFGTVTVGSTTIGVSNLAALNLPSCTINTGFHPYVNATVRTIEATGTGVFFGGGFTQAGDNAGAPQSRSRLAAVSATGSLLAWAPMANTTVRTLAVTPDGTRVFVGGDFDTINGSNSHALAVVNSTSGATVHAFPGFYEDASDTKAIVMDSGTNAAYIGNEGHGSGVFDGRTAISLSSYAQIWRDTCLGATQALAVYDGVLYSGSHAHDCSTMREWPDGVRQHLNAEPLGSPQMLPWSPDTNDGIGEGIGPRSLIVANGILWVAGEFTTVNGSTQQSLTRFDSGPDNSTATVPAVSTVSLTPGTATVHWRTSDDPDDATLTYRVYRDGGADPIYTTTGDSAWWQHPQLSYTDTGLADGSTHTYTVTASDSNSTSPTSSPSTVTVVAAAPGYAAAVEADHPSLYWRLDEVGPTFAADSSAGNNNGLYPNPGVTYRAAGALAGDTDPGITLTGRGNLASDHRNPSPTSYSSELWFKTTTTTGGHLIGFNVNPSILNYAYDRQVYMTNGGKIAYGIGPASTAKSLISTKAYNDGKWHQVVAVQSTASGGGMRLYLDGALVASNAATTGQRNYGSLGGYWRVGGDTIGSAYPSVPTGVYFTGSIDEVSTYSTALSAARVLAHYQAGLADEPTAPPPVSPGPHAALGDFNGDGKADYAVFRPSNGVWYVKGQPNVQWGRAGDLPVEGDFNGDGKADYGVFRPSNGVWYVQGQPNVQWGQAGDLPVAGDFNGDGKADYGVFRPSTGVWYVKGQPNFVWGKPGDIPVAADFNGDGKADYAVFRPSNGVWYVKGLPNFVWGKAGDIPVAGDFNGDGKADYAVFRPSNGVWYVKGLTNFVWGKAGDLPSATYPPTPGDFNGDGKADYGVFRPSNGVWYVKGVPNVQWGQAGDVPVAGDFNGDGKADYGVFRPSNGVWYVKGVPNVQWGQAGDVPVAGDFNGDGKADYGVFRPSNGVWYVKGVPNVQWGQAGDVPVAGDFNGDGRADYGVFRPSTGVWYVKGQPNFVWGKAGDIPVAGDFNGDGKADYAVFRPSNGVWYVKGLPNVVWGRNGDRPV